MEILIRQLPYARADGATNMADDETMVRSAADGIASLRFYGWACATASLGYFQPAAVRLAEPCLAELPWVRRPSGGGTIVHHHELTYALALPFGPAWGSPGAWMPRMHRLIVESLGEFGLTSGIELAPAPARYGDVLCFQQCTTGDVLCQGTKIAGSAQRKYRQALLQHGSILLARSDSAPALAGVRELTGMTLQPEELAKILAKRLCTNTGWRRIEQEWTEQEEAARGTLAHEKYGHAAWNERR